jgi:hypothetical protein
MMKIPIWIFWDDYWHKWVDHRSKKVDDVQTIPSGCEDLNVLYNGGEGRGAGGVQIIECILLLDLLPIKF